MIQKKIIVFVSHASTDSDLAIAIKELVEDAFSGALDVFVSSDRRSLPGGKEWFPMVREKLKKAGILIAILSPQSTSRPWVHFEAGAAFATEVPLLAVCTNGLTPAHVAAPLNAMQLLAIGDKRDVAELISHISRECNYGKPKPDPKKLNRVAKLAAPSDVPLPLTPAAKENEGAHVQKMREEWDALAGDRRTFWEALNSFYHRDYAGKAAYPDTIEALVDLASPPKGLPLPQGEHLRSFGTKYGRLLSGHDAMLYAVCNAIYAPKDPSSSLKALSAMRADNFDAFHEARGRLSKFWNRWGDSVYVHRTVGLDTITREFDGHYRIVKFLPYLEISLVRSTEDDGVGKQWLFRVAKDWPRISA